MAFRRDFSVQSLAPQGSKNDLPQTFEQNIDAMRKIASERLTSKSRRTSHYIEDPEPLKLGQRIVLRSQTPVPIAVLARLNSLYKSDSVIATELLATMIQGEETWPRNIYYRSAVRAIFEE